MSFYLATSGSLSANSMNNPVQVYPEYDYENPSKKIEDRSRARSGREYVYKWGQYDVIKFSVDYVNSSDKTVINSWWGVNEPLIFIDSTMTKVCSVRITNDSKPISKVMKPYMDLFGGVIELETY